jgi:hypothetical protein
MGARRPVSRGNHSAAALAVHMCKSPRTIRNYVAEPRVDYEARSAERAQPWMALGISRRTWYRRRQRQSN